MTGPIDSTVSILHDRMAAQIKFFSRAAEGGDSETAAYWYDKYLKTWDTLEVMGLDLTGVPLPAIGKLHTNGFHPIRWSQHNGFTNKR